MRTLQTLSLAIALAGALLCPLGAQASQMELTAEAREKAERADKTLNQVYAKLAARLDPVSKKKLLVAELAWIKYRDAQRESEADWYRGGSLSNWQYFTCDERMTKARTADLQEALEAYHIR